MKALLKDIKELERDMYVKEYLEKKAKYDKISETKGYEIPYISEEELLEKAIKESDVNTSNNIYVCMAAYNGKHGLDSENIKSEYRALDIKVDYDAKDADYKQYYNIELSDSDEGYEVNIPIYKCKEFEHNNIVLYPPDSDLADNYYKYIKRTYYSTIYEENEEKALDKVMAKVNKNK